jgi:hypothetical protein
MIVPLRPAPGKEEDEEARGRFGIEPLATCTAEELPSSIGLAVGSTEHQTLVKEIGFSYCQVLG